MKRKRCIIETINDMLKNTAQLVHSWNRSANKYIKNMAVLVAYCFYHINNLYKAYSLLYFAIFCCLWILQ